MSGRTEDIQALLDEGQAEAALSRAREILQAKPDRAGVARLAALAAAATGRAEEISAEFERLVTSHPTDAWAQAAAERLVSTSRPAAFAAAERAAPSVPEHPVVARLLCEQAIKAADHAAARATGLKGLASRPVTVSHTVLAHQLLHLGLRPEVTAWMADVEASPEAFANPQAAGAFERFAEQQKAIAASGSVRLETAEHGRAVLFVFSGLRNRPGMSEESLIAALEGLPVHVVILRDPDLLMYMAGVPGLGVGFDVTCEAMRRMARDLGAERILTFGVSGGGYAALVYADALDAHAVLGDSALTIMTEDSMRRDGRAGAVADRMLAETPDQLRDMREVLRARATPIRVELLYGAEMPIDRAYAERMADVPGVRLRPFAKLSGHPVASQLPDEEAGELLRDFVSRALDGDPASTG